MESVKTHIFPSPEAVAYAFGQHIRDIVGKKSVFHWALSGGSTPKILFEQLALKKEEIPWEKIHFWWGDERCVSPDDPDSNYGMTHRLLFSHVPVISKQIHRMKGEAGPEQESERYAEEIKQHVPSNGIWPEFDLVMLGMGSDGHTASIFPHQMELLKEPSICAVAQHPETGQHRITLTGGVINASQEVAFLVTGASKQKKVGEIFNQTGSYRSYPAFFIRPRQGVLHWFIDETAAERI